jgi:tetratricopeptide (TPR) repeat protein
VEWRSALNEAAEVGLLTQLRAGSYLMHPALSTYLSAQWRNEEPAGHEATREAAARALLGACAACGDWLVKQMASGETIGASSILDMHRRTFGSMLRYALDCQLWEQAMAIFGPLGLYCNARDMTEEADAWTDQVLLATEEASGPPPGIESPIGVLWLAAATRQANKQCDRFQLNLAENTYRQIYALLVAAPSSPWQQLSLMGILIQFGIVAHRRKRLDDAEEWYFKALAISNQIGNRTGMVGTIHLLGVVARDRNLLDEAEGLFRRSVALQEKSGRSSGLAANYRELGSIAYLLGGPEEAQPGTVRHSPSARRSAVKPNLLLLAMS